MGTIVDLDELAAASLANDDYLLIRDTSDVTNRDKKLQAGVFARKFGTPTALRVAQWKDANSLEDGGFAASDIALLSVAQTFSALQTFSAGIKLSTTTLSVYETSTWSPVITGSTGNPTVSYGAQVGKYQRIGPRIYYELWLALNTISGGSGDARISLPASVSPSSNAPGSCMVIGVDLPGTPVGVVFLPISNAAHGLIHTNQDNGSPLAVQISGLAAADYIFVSGHYELA